MQSKNFKVMTRHVMHKLKICTMFVINKLHGVASLVYWLSLCIVKPTPTPPTPTLRPHHLPSPHLNCHNIWTSCLFSQHSLLRMSKSCILETTQHLKVCINQKHCKIAKSCPEYILSSFRGVMLFLPIYFFCQFNFFIFVKTWFLGFITIWVWLFCHNFSF